MSTIQLQSADGQVFEADAEAIKASLTIKTMIENLETDENVIKLPKINGRTLEKVLTWATHHKHDTPPVSDPLIFVRQQAIELNAWDKVFFNVDIATHFELLSAASYLDMKGLLDAACLSVANIITGKSPEELREIMGVKNDFTPEEENRIRMENRWTDRRQ